MNGRGEPRADATTVEDVERTAKPSGAGSNDQASSAAAEDESEAISLPIEQGDADAQPI